MRRFISGFYAINPTITTKKNQSFHIVNRQRIVKISCDISQKTKPIYLSLNSLYKLMKIILGSKKI